MLHSSITNHINLSKALSLYLVSSLVSNPVSSLVSFLMVTTLPMKTLIFQGRNRGVTASGYARGYAGSHVSHGNPANVTTVTTFHRKV